MGLILSGSTLRVALPIALLVGTTLVSVNLGTALLAGEVDGTTALRIVANYAVPYLVSSIGYLSARTRDTTAVCEWPNDDRGDAPRGGREVRPGPTVMRMTNQRTESALASADHPVSPDGPRRPALLIFDVNETLSDMSPMSRRFEDVGAPAHLAKTWFAGLLRDGFALTAVDASAPFARIAAEALRTSLHGLPLNRETDEAVGHIMEGFAGLPVHADVPDGIRALNGLGIRMVTLSNGSASVAEALFDRAGVRDHFEALLSVEQAGIWKPGAGAYAYALEQCGVDPMDAMLVAVHPWDIDGAARAGLATAWIDRDEGVYPEYFRSPDLIARSLIDLAEQLR